MKKIGTSTSYSLACIAILLYFGYLYGLMSCGPSDWFQPESPIELAKKFLELLLLPWNPNLLLGWFGTIGAITIVVVVWVPLIIFGLSAQRRNLSRNSLVLLIPQIPNLISLLWGAYWEPRTKMMGMECWQLALVHHSFWMAAALLVIVTALPFASKSCGSQRTLFLCAVPLQLYQTQLTALIVSLSIQKPPL